VFLAKKDLDDADMPEATPMPTIHDLTCSCLCLSVLKQKINTTLSLFFYMSSLRFFDQNATTRFRLKLKAGIPKPEEIEELTNELNLQ
jgi:hypothetical protein